MTPHDENYWRALAVDAQAYAALAYSIAQRHASEGARQLARVYQGLAYETHLKALARLGLAVEEREGRSTKWEMVMDARPRTRHFQRVGTFLKDGFFIDHDPAVRLRTDINEWTLERYRKS